MAESLLRMRLFAAVYEERSFTAAAQRENATQSGVSQHIHKLEDQLGVKLLARGTSTVVPTPAGDAYYASCIRVLQAHEEANRVARAFGTGLDGELVVGLTPTMARASLAPTLARFIDEHPNVVVRIVEAYSDVVTDKVRAGEIDFAIVPGVKSDPGMLVSAFARTPELLVSGPAFAARLGLARLAPVRLADLGPVKIVLPTNSQVRRASIEHVLAVAGVTVERRLEIDTMLGTLDFIAKTDWIAILPGIMMVSELARGELQINALAEPAPLLDLYSIQQARRPLSPVALSFLAVLNEETTRLGVDITRALERGRD